MKKFTSEKTLEGLCEIVKPEIENLKQGVQNAQNTANAALPKSGGTITGVITRSEDNDPNTRLLRVPHTTIAFYQHDIISSSAWGETNDGESFRITGVKSPTYNADAANKLYVDSSIIRTNLLDNAYLVNPINQRGLMEYTSSGYTIDRWKINAGTVSVNDGFVKFSGTQNNYASFIQIVDKNILDYIKGKVITLSCICRKNSGNASLIATNGVTQLINASINSSSFNILSQSAFVPADSNECMFGIQFNNTASSIDIIAFKLELGSTQTLAHKEGDTWVLNDPPPDRALELLKCQRYFYSVPTDGTFINGLGTAYSSTQLESVIPFPVQMRTKPSVSFNLGNYANKAWNNATETWANSTHDITGFSIDQYHGSYAVIYVNSTGLSASANYDWQMSGNNCKIEFSADL